MKSFFLHKIYVRIVWGNQMMERIEQALVVVLFMVLCMGGCNVSHSDGTKVSDLEYTVVEDAKVPEELRAMIEEKKAADFKLTFEAEDGLYIVRGYGEQETGGYSISVNELCLTTNSIYFKTTLLGPGESQKITKAPSYPYIVVKTKKQDKNIVFD